MTTRQGIERNHKREIMLGEPHGQGKPRKEKIERCGAEQRQEARPDSTAKPDVGTDGEHAESEAAEKRHPVNEPMGTLAGSDQEGVCGCEQARTLIQMEMSHYQVVRSTAEGPRHHRMLVITAATTSDIMEGKRGAGAEGKEGEPELWCRIWRTVRGACIESGPNVDLVSGGRE